MKHRFLAALLTLALLSGALFASTASAGSAGVGHDWSSDFRMPSASEIEARSQRSAGKPMSADERSPYLAAWFSIGTDTRYSEYCVDIKADFLPAGTYCCAANWNMDLSSLERQYREVWVDYISGYAGFQRSDVGEGCGAILSLWDINCIDDAGRQTVIRAKQTYPEPGSNSEFGNEGTGVHALVPYDWKAGQWYRMLLQCSVSEETGNTTVEQWILDLDADQWTHICTFDTGVRDSCFIGPIAVFLENYLQQYAGEVRSMEFANARIHSLSDGQWHDVTDVYWISKESGTGSWQFGADEYEFYMITTGVDSAGPNPENHPLSVKNFSSGAPY